MRNLHTPGRDDAFWTTNFDARTNARDRITQGSGPVLAGTARGRVLELIGQLRPKLVEKKEPPKPPEAKKEEKPAEPKKEEKPAEKKA